MTDLSCGNGVCHWHLDAVFYQVYVRGFLDSSRDGNGDLRGLIEKLDYIQSLGVSCLWLMPSCSCGARRPSSSRWVP